MLKKTLAAVGLAGLLVLGGSAAASADTYPPIGEPDVGIDVSSFVIAPGGTSTITITGIPDAFPQVVFIAEGPAGASLASIVPTSVSTVSTTKTVTDGVASADFAATAAGTYAVTVIGPPDTILASIEITVDPALAGGPGTPGGPSLPDTGGAFPATALWLGLGAVGIGGIAVAAGIARRRATSH